MNWHITTRHSPVSKCAPSAHYCLSDAYLARRARGEPAEVLRNDRRVPDVRVLSPFVFLFSPNNRCFITTHLIVF